MSATLRYRGNKSNLVELAKNLDAFKKVPEKYTETSEIGGTLSLLSRLLIILLIYKELCYYQEANLVFQFEPDIDMDDKVQMHVDITVAMPCQSLSGVDLMDETQQDVFAYGTLQRDDVWWQMTAEQRQQFERSQAINSFLREEYHSVADVIFKDIINSNEVPEMPVHNVATMMEERQKQQQQQYDACRLHGTLGLNKVAGVLHLVGGAEPIVGLFQDHWMIEFRRVQMNFTHRINRLSFGRYAHRIVQPLEGDERIVSDELTTVQYFLKIVPTIIHNTFFTINTFQYAVTENVRVLDSKQSSYGAPGIYFKYDWSALKIVVRTDRDHILQFLIRLCSIIAGIVVISGILNSMLVCAQQKLIGALAPQLLAHKAMQQTAAAHSGGGGGGDNGDMTTPAQLLPQTNQLISLANNMSMDDGAASTAVLLPITTAQQL